MHGHGKGTAVVNLLISRGVDGVIAMNIGYGAFTRLRERGVKVFYISKTQGKPLVKLVEAVEMFMAGKIEEGVEPREEHEAS